MLTALRWVVRIGSGGACLLTLHTALNARLLRTPPADPPPVAERIAVLLPLRDEAHRVGPCLRAALVALDACRDAGLFVLDDDSADGTADVVRRIAGSDPRVRLLDGAPLPPGWLGKPHACQQLADTAAPADCYVFLDADVILEPHAIAATVALLRWSGLDLICPYPRQLTGSAAERLVQPLLQWSWLTTLPLRLAERSPRESLAAANGQLLAVDAAAYHRAGGHCAIRAEVLDDIALLRAIKRSGGRGVVVDGSGLASCRMYEGWSDLRDGYGKSLWSAGSGAGTAAAFGVLAIVYIVPPLAALRGSPAGLVGYAAGVGGRVIAARRTGGRVWPDVLAHPVSVGLLGLLAARSRYGHRRSTLSWKGRPIQGPVQRGKVKR